MALIRGSQVTGTVQAAVTAQTATSASYAVTASYALSANAFPFLGSAVITGSLEIVSNINDIFLIKNNSNQPILTVSQSGVIVVATQSQDPTGAAPNGAMYFTSASFFIGLD